jgi:hypothetical protein
MPLQQNKTRKNYIGIVSDATEQERVAEKAIRSWPRVMSYLADRLMAALGRHCKGALGPPRP